VTLRARLVLSLGGLVALALLLAGVLVVQFTRANLIDQLDDELRAMGFGASGPGPPFEDAGGGRRFALIAIDRHGTVTSRPSGPVASPDPLPTLDGLDAADGGPHHGRILERTSPDGSTTYRVRVFPGNGGTTAVVAAPMRLVDGPIRALLRNLVIVGLTILGAVLAVAFLVIRQGMRPLETIARTADTISAGDLSRRADLPNDRSEVGRLGSAFDQMLDQIQGAFEQQRTALDARERSENRLRQFVADASHELRTPLTTVRGYADLYRAGGLGEREALDRAMARIGTESRRMGGLVEDLLLLARLDQGRPLRREPVDLSLLVADAVADARLLQPDRPITDAVRPGIRVTGDEDRLRQVIGNLLANVRVHTPTDTPAEVSLEASDGRALLRVADRGPGIDPALGERVFDRFFRADPGRSRDRGGSGLGLSIAASVAQAHGGSVGHEATPGGGATFVVTLPLAPEAQAPPSG